MKEETEFRLRNGTPLSMTDRESLLQLQNNYNSLAHMFNELVKQYEDLGGLFADSWRKKAGLIDEV